MQPAAAFGDVLDSLVGEFPVENVIRGWHPGIATTPLFSFRRPLDGTPRRPARTLSGPERDALDFLNSFGADLDAAFTRDELRSAFRALAHRFHPDVNPRATGREFVLLREAYDILSRRAA
jgi:hypothetical protein